MQKAVESHRPGSGLKEKGGEMGRRALSLVICIIFSCAGNTFAADRDVDARDLKGIHKSHRYLWAVIGGTAAGAGLGVIAPGGTKSAFKGALLGGSLTSAFYLAKNPHAARGSRAWAHVVTNATLGTGILWTLCDCGSGAWAGGLIGGGGTALFQGFGSHNSRIAAAQPDPSSSGTSAQTTAGSQPKNDTSGSASTVDAKTSTRVEHRKTTRKEGTHSGESK